MATSGTVGRMQLDVTGIIEHAFRRCGKLASTVSGELQQAARELLGMQLVALSNRGINLWCIQKYVLQVQAGQAAYTLPEGVTDVINVLSRSATELTGIVSASSDSVQIAFTAPTIVANVSALFTAPGTVYLVLESSDDTLTWRAMVSLKQQDVLAEDRVVFDVDNSRLARYWRLRTTTGVMPAVSIRWNAAGQDLPMTKLNRDDYMNLPNKQFSIPSGQRSLQYWYDKQIVPQIWIWPLSQGSVDQVALWVQRQIQDVGAFSNTLDIPQRWQLSTMATLAKDLALEIPPQELPPGRYMELKQDAAEKLTDAEDGESDGAPIRIAPNLRPYTA